MNYRCDSREVGLNTDRTQSAAQQQELQRVCDIAGSSRHVRDPRVVLSLLEADQVVAAKQRTRFGPRSLSLGTRVLLWGLRIYVVVMLVIVLISVLRALR